MNRLLGKKTSVVPKNESAAKKPYPPTITIRDIVVSGQIRAQLCTNSLGNFIDIRYFAGNNPTKRGIRLRITDFLSTVSRLKDDMMKLVDNEEE